jgi:hypothetical protein
MNRFPLTVLFRDGTTADVDCDQYSIGVWERWAAKSGLRQSMSDPGPLAFTQLRVMAWAELQRDAKTKTSFEGWDSTVSEVSSNGPTEAVDPTRTGT